VKASVRTAASYQLAILGYGGGMTLSTLGETSSALLFIAVASLVAATRFIFEVA
jgi:hypothetical protein